MEAWREYLMMIATGRSVKESKKGCPCPDNEGSGGDDSSLIIDSNGDFVIDSNGDFLLVFE